MEQRYPPSSDSETKCSIVCVDAWIEFKENSLTGFPLRNLGEVLYRAKSLLPFQNAIINTLKQHVLNKLLYQKTSQNPRV